MVFVVEGFEFTGGDARAFAARAAQGPRVTIYISRTELLHIPDMTETIRCSGCDFLLYFGEDISGRLHHRLSEKSVLEGYHNRCPRCGSSLSPESVAVKVSPPGMRRVT